MITQKVTWSGETHTMVMDVHSRMQRCRVQWPSLLCRVVKGTHFLNQRLARVPSSSDNSSACLQWGSSQEIEAPRLQESSVHAFQCSSYVESRADTGQACVTLGYFCSPVFHTELCPPVSLCCSVRRQPQDHTTVFRSFLHFPPRSGTLCLL